MIKKITKEDVMNLSINDEIVLYGITASATIVNKKLFRITRPPYQDIWDANAILMECKKIREDGTVIRSRYWWTEQITKLQWHKDDEYFGSFDGSCTRYYLNPKTPCEKVIKRLQEEKRNINRKIIECQNYMYKITD
jgi:hypothetical protein